MDYELIVDNRDLTVVSTSTVITPILSDANSANAVLVFEQTNTTIVSGEGQIINLEAGRNDLQILVTAGDDSTRLYTIAVTRLDGVVLNDVRLIRATDIDCSSTPVATVRVGGMYSACVDRFPLDTSGMVLFTTLEGDMTPTETTHNLDEGNTRPALPTSYTVSIIGAPSSVTYLMLTVTVVDMGTTATP